MVEAAAGLVGGDVPAAGLVDRIEALVDEVFASGLAWTVTPERSRGYDRRMREGSQRFTAEVVVDEVNRGIDLACQQVRSPVRQPVEITPVDGVLSDAQAAAVRQVVCSPWRAGVIVAPAGAGKTSSLAAARAAWNQVGKQVVGLAPTGKAADVMTMDNVADSSSTIARVLWGTESLSASQVAAQVGWTDQTVVVVDEAGMVSNRECVRLLDIAASVDARVVFVGDPHQYAAVNQRSGLLGTLAAEVPDAVELREVFRQRDAAERRMSTWLRNGGAALVSQAAQWYAEHGRVHAGSATAMLTDALEGWSADRAAGLDSVLIAGDNDTVDALNRAAQSRRVAAGEVNASGRSCRLGGGVSPQQGFVGDVIITRRNDYELVTSSGEPVRNGQRWVIDAVGRDGSVALRRCDSDGATVVVPGEYLGEHAHLQGGRDTDALGKVVRRHGPFLGRVYASLHLARWQDADSEPGAVDALGNDLTRRPL
ncbi:AAA family ATPase [Corynebacterium heidelbergense]|uniref:AAA family ATPase n=1 Tax=Corynebacterium heidelbergense TaxID=2055947 RepID=UPI0015EEB6FD|nr:AAA family ATPase [Corynebacterium heidelbergense]WCZ35910.1 Multifunctional conjugation protein TraI [Corynebacterium heidelbergense]